MHILTLTFFLPCFLASFAVADKYCELEVHNGTYRLKDPKSLQCRICGYMFGSPPIKCYAFNGTFDGIYRTHNLSAVNTTYAPYLTASWQNLAIHRQNTLHNPIIPSSHLQYARTVLPNTAAVLDLTYPVNDTTNWWPFGDLREFDFACAAPAVAREEVGNGEEKKEMNEPVACTLNVTSTCMNVSYADYNSVTPFYVSQTYTFDPSNTNINTNNSNNSTVSTMQSGSWLGLEDSENGDDGGPGWAAFGQFCYNYTFEATATVAGNEDERDGDADQGDVYLYLDSVVFVHWYNWQS